MLNNFIDRIKLSFRKDKELYLSLYEILGFYPHDISYYKMALLHKSIMHRNSKGKPVNNERLEAMACVLSVKNDIVPPTINHEEGDDDPELDYNLNFTFNKAQKREVRAALSNTFGFGGHNCCVVFKKYAE
jgi:hypothetical protein